MKNKSKRIVYWLATGLLTLMILMTIGNSIFNSEFSNRFVRLGFPTYLIAPLMIAKIVGLIALWSNKTKQLKKWAYISFFFLFVLAMIIEIRATDTDYISPSLALILLLISYIFSENRKAN
jgi:hypothetical protein